MRKLLLSAAAAVSALVVGTPAAAQYFPVPQGHAYGYHHDNYGQVRRLEARVDQLRRTIFRLDQVGRLSHREARRLDRHAVDLQQRIRFAAARGLHPRERYEIERRVEGLRQAIRYEARDGNRWGWNGYDRNDNGYGYYSGRRDGRGSDGRWDHEDDGRHDDRGRRGRGRDRDDDDDGGWDRD
jgi:hypothetical protein